MGIREYVILNTTAISYFSASMCRGLNMEHATLQVYQGKISRTCEITCCKLSIAEYPPSRIISPNEPNGHCHGPNYTPSYR